MARSLGAVGGGYSTGWGFYGTGSGAGEVRPARSVGAGAGGAGPGRRPGGGADGAAGLGEEAVAGEGLRGPWAERKVKQQEPGEGRCRGIFRCR